MCVDYLDTPLGILKLTATSKGVSGIVFADERAENHRCAGKGSEILDRLKEELVSYFEGRLIRFTCPISVEGTSFQKRVWTKLAEIPFGTTKSYGQIATELGQPTAARAVGGANNKNPIPIVIPCHRVVGAQKVLVGFAGGLWRKQWMLEHEGIHLPLG
ncbi:methylated-DNA--[protein]-cysteine S-methyltransferase [Pelagicoccus albus]|uniref:Methylated-DNA--protein-cysteine methyltransferase n=1 Tax=Pelagicoccus albus TaxID=415222 RepID=A0A7X1B9P0_9BACT|nr:methylated-DNA--[protein]-cysteine S-methyltransferase [Pelagicoccus albus]